MNILPKKSWHVRNKDNVARVRRDEAKALEEEQEVAKRRALAEQEARIRILREKAKASVSAKKEAEWDLPQEPKDKGDEEEEGLTVVSEKVEYATLNTAFPADQHINLFEDFEKKKKSQGANQDYEKEKRKAQEAYEKKIGYLTYLGQSAVEMSSQKPWYENLPVKRDDKSETIKTTFSEQETMRIADPLLSMKSYLDKKKHAEDIFYGRTMEVSLAVDKTRKRRFNEGRGKYSSDLDNKNKLRKYSPEKDNSVPELEATSSSTSGKKHKHKKDKKDSKKKKSKKHKKSSHSSVERSPEPKRPSMEELRTARVNREAAERRRSVELVSRLQGYSTPARSVIDERTLKYNTVYMPRGRRK